MNGHKSDIRPAIAASPLQMRDAAIKSIANRTDLSPSMKRQVLRSLGVSAEYVPHQGAREKARRLSKIQKVA